MELVLIDGGPASGKNTLGELILTKFQELGEKTVLLDLDTYVEQLNPIWVWESEQQREKDQLNARLNIAKDIDRYLQEDYRVITIGERSLTKEDVSSFINRLEITPPTYLYHLSVPFKMRERRLHKRGPHSLIDLVKDQEDRDAVLDWPGFVYENKNSPEEDAVNLMNIIKQSKGLMSGNKK
jgi:hypothetical protein